MERIKNSLLEGLVGILLTIGKVAAKSLILVPMLYLFCWLTGRHFPSYETFLWFLLGGLWFTDVPKKTRQDFLRRFRAHLREPAEAKPL